MLLIQILGCVRTDFLRTQLISKMWVLTCLKVNSYLKEDCQLSLCRAELQLKPPNMHRKPMLGFFLPGSVNTLYKENYMSLFVYQYKCHNVTIVIFWRSAGRLLAFSNSSHHGLVCEYASTRGLTGGESAPAHVFCHRQSHPCRVCSGWTRILMNWLITWGPTAEQWEDKENLSKLSSVTCIQPALPSQPPSASSDHSQVLEIYFAYCSKTQHCSLLRPSCWCNSSEEDGHL